MCHHCILTVIGPMPYGIAADAVLLLHLAFVIFVTLGAFLVLRWRRLMWIHLPAAIWGIWIEWSGSACPLTPLENELRVRAGESPYAGDFLDRYLVGFLYPGGLTREIQILLGLIVLVINGVLYWKIARTRPHGGPPFAKTNGRGASHG
jgi:hypothetical protein